MDERRFAGADDLDFTQREENTRQRPSVIERPMRYAGIDPEPRSEVLELGTPRVQLARERQRVVGARLRAAEASQQWEIKVIAVVRDEDVLTAERLELRPHCVQRRRASNIVVGDAMRPCRPWRDRAARPNENAQLLARHAVPNAYGGHLDDFRRRHVRVRRLQVDRREVAELVPEAPHPEELGGFEERERQAERRTVNSRSFAALRMTNDPNFGEHSLERDLRTTKPW